MTLKIVLDSIQTTIYFDMFRDKKGVEEIYERIKDILHTLQENRMQIYL